MKKPCTHYKEAVCLLSVLAVTSLGAMQENSNIGSSDHGIATLEAKGKHIKDLDPASAAAAKALAEAAKGIYLDEVQRIIQKADSDGLDIIAVINAGDQYGKNAFHRAAEQGRAETVRFLLDEGADINAEDHAGNTALHLAADTQYTLHWGDPSKSISGVVETLLNSPDILPNKTNKLGRPPLEVAIYKQDYDGARTLLHNLDRLDLNTPNSKTGDTALHTAAYWGYHMLVEKLLADSRTTVNPKNAQGMTPLGCIPKKDPFEYPGNSNYRVNHDRVRKLLLAKNATL
ncbi:hypothetical protein FACS1894126_1990 [Alphaproteobacteria bacterium]|nr:hypothetical protein FACS1894126_1990 [Alphaproteobacteria bacterium]